MLQLYDSLSRNKKDFVPLSKGIVKLYVCGITPNNSTHLGHAFTYAVFDTLIRYLKFKGLSVTYIQNATDINDGDDVIKQAAEAGKSWTEIARQWIEHFHKQMNALNVLPPDKYILASSVMGQIISMNEALIANGFAYVKNGNVYFDISKFEGYGSLSKYGRDQMLMISQERGNDPTDPNKKNPMDFVLWVKAKGDPNWKSPWGPGRPGWHIECSAMVEEALGDQIDIHGGGRDLIFPHHESEVAQSESFTGKKPYVQFWMHTGMVMFEGEKMSKSLGNLVLVEDLLKKYSSCAIRWLLLSHHYRHPWEYEEDELKNYEKKFKALRSRLQEQNSGDWKKVEGFLEDDFNTPEALRYLEVECGGDTLKKGLDLLGFKI